MGGCQNSVRGPLEDSRGLSEFDCGRPQQAHKEGPRVLEGLLESILDDSTGYSVRSVNSSVANSSQLTDSSANQIRSDHSEPAHAVELRKKGLNDGEIAKQLGVTRRTVQRYLRLCGS
jgi:DNA-binding NarL/FixJ family response regulator